MGKGPGTLQPPQHPDRRPGLESEMTPRPRAEDPEHRGSLIERGIRVNGVAPGPIWTPLIRSTFPEEKVANFGADTPMKRAGLPEEVASCFVFLASNDSSYLAGRILHPNGGEIVNG